MLGRLFYVKQLLCVIPTQGCHGQQVKLGRHLQHPVRSLARKHLLLTLHSRQGGQFQLLTQGEEQFCPCLVPNRGGGSKTIPYPWWRGLEQHTMCFTRLSAGGSPRMPVTGSQSRVGCRMFSASLAKES